MAGLVRKDTETGQKFERLKKMNKAKQKVFAALAAIMLLLVLTVSSAVAAPVGTKESDVIKYAKSWIGVPNVHSGNSRSGIDCSHLVAQVYTKAGAKYSFMIVSAMKTNKYTVTTKSPKPGDMLFWKKNITQNGRNYNLVNHVGVYIGNGQFIHTGFGSKTKVCTDSIKSSPWKDGAPYYARWTRTK